MSFQHPFSSWGGPSDPRSPVRFLLVHEHGDFALHAQEEHTTHVHALSIGRSSCSILWHMSHGYIRDVGLRLRRPSELLHTDEIGPEGISLLLLVEEALRRDAAQKDEVRMLEVLENYRRIIAWRFSSM